MGMLFIKFLRSVRACCVLRWSFLWSDRSRCVKCCWSGSSGCCVIVFWIVGFGCESVGSGLFSW